MVDFEHLCRVCAANTKHKNTESVSILATAQLKEKLERFLYLKISEDDPLPKVLCKSCFRQVESTASLSKIAKHTQSVLCDFVRGSQQKPHQTSDAEFTPLSLTTPRVLPRAHQISDEPSLPPPPPPPPSATQGTHTRSLSASPKAAGKCRLENEVVLNVSIKDPLTMETQQRKIYASQRRQTLLGDMRFTPKSIAQRFDNDGPAIATSLSPAVTIIQASRSKSSIANAGAAAMPGGTINYSSDIDVNSRESDTGMNMASANPQARGQAKTTVRNGAPPDPVRPQSSKGNRRKNPVTMKAHTSCGQISLLKVSQQRQQQQEPPQVSGKIKPQLLLNDDLVDVLPEKPIIAGKKQKQQNSTRQQQQMQKHILPEVELISEPVAVPNPQLSPPSAALLPPQPQPPSAKVAGYVDEVPLGRVIKDPDLLKLILKALKWPVNPSNADYQMSRLRNSKFNDIMSDPNLVQDADLIQILGPYINPFIYLAHNAMAAAATHVPTPKPPLASRPITPIGAPLEKKSSEPYQVPPEIAAAIPYKLPAETSVQLVPASPPQAMEEQPSTSRNAMASIDNSLMMEQPPSAKKRKPAVTKRREPSIVISSDEGEEDDVEAKLKVNKVQKKVNSRSGGKTVVEKDRSLQLIKSFSSEIDPRFLANFTTYTAPKGSADSKGSDALLTLLERQRKPDATHRLHGGADPSFDDIVLVEHRPTPDKSPKPSARDDVKQKVLSSDKSNNITITNVPLSAFGVLENSPELTVVTRPIIKRRKANISASKAGATATVVSSVASSTTESNEETEMARKKSADSTERNSPSESAPKASVSVGVTAFTGVNKDVLTQAPSKTNLATQVSSSLVPVKTSVDTQVSKVDVKEIASQISGETLATSTQSAGTQVDTDGESKPEASTLATQSSETSVITKASAVDVSTSTTSLNASREPVKKVSKAALGIQLMEAIGLQTDAIVAAPEVTGKPTPEVLLKPKESVQQIRSALKRSLKEAQEHSKRKNVEPQVVKQVADSTTKQVQMLNQAKEEKVEVESPTEENEGEERKTERVETPRGKRKGNRSGVQRKTEDASSLEDEADEEPLSELRKLNSSSDSWVTIMSSPTEIESPKRRGRKAKTPKEEEPKDKTEEPSRASSLNTRKARGIAAQPDIELQEVNDKKPAEVSLGSTSGRPARASKKMSRYYKGPENARSPTRTFFTRASSRKRT